MRELRAPFLATGVATGVLLPFVVPILAIRGFSAEGIGLLLAITSVAVVVAMPAWGHVADALLGRRRTLQWAALLSVAAALWLGAPMALPVVGAALLFWYVLQTAIPTLLDSIAMRTLGGQRDSYGHLRLLESFSFAIAAFGAGILYDLAGYGASYFVFAATAIALVILIQPVPEPPRIGLGASRPLSNADPAANEVHGSAEPVGPPRRAGRPRLGLGSIGAALSVGPRLVGALAAILLASVGLLAANTFLPLRLHDLGAAPSTIAMSATISALFEIPAMLSGRRLVARLGLRGFFALGCLMYLLALASWIVVDNPVVLVASRALTGLGYGSFTVASVVALGAILPEELQASGQAMRQSAISAVAVVGFLAGGLIYGLLGSATFFAIAACGPILGALVGWRWLPARGRVHIHLDTTAMNPAAAAAAIAFASATASAAGSPDALDDEPTSQDSWI
jgi:MFS family permease